MKQNIIFLDIDGVLNGYNFWNLLGWNLVCLLRNEKLKEWYRKTTNPCGTHESKVKRLAKIVRKTNAKIVMSSSWRGGFWYTPYDEKDGHQKELTDLLMKYNIQVIDITPNLHKGRRDVEILSWLGKHEDEVRNFIILDDENSFLEVFQTDDRFIQTSSVPRGKMIMGHWYENTGLKRKHVRRAIKVLKQRNSLYEVPKNAK